MRRVALAGVIAGWAVVAALAAPASADNGSTTASDGGSTVNVGASSSSAGTGPATNPVAGQSGVSTSACHYTPLPAQDAAAFGAGGPAPGGWFFVSFDQRTWENEAGERRWRVEVTADEIGPSLRFATAEISRTERRGPDQVDQADGSDRSGDADVVSLDA